MGDRNTHTVVVHVGCVIRAQNTANTSTADVSCHSLCFGGHPHKTQAKDAAEGEFLGPGNLQFPDKEDRKKSDDQVLNSANSSHSYNDGSFIATGGLILEPPGNIKDVEEAMCGVACKSDEEDEGDAVDGAEYDGCPDPIHESDGEGGSYPSVEAQDRDFDQGRADHVVDLNGHCNLGYCQYQPKIFSSKS